MDQRRPSHTGDSPTRPWHGPRLNVRSMPLAPMQRPCNGSSTGFTGHLQPDRHWALRGRSWSTAFDCAL